MKWISVRVGSILALFFVAFSPRVSLATFHLSVIDEVMTSYDNDSSVQFVEIRMLTSFQNSVANSVLGAFDTGGNYLGDVLVVPQNVQRSGADVRWLMATSQFKTITGLTPDFIMPAQLPAGGGMLCWGAPGVVVPPPESWDHSDPNNYVDCVAYGTYNGPTNRHIGTPTPLDANGHSLVRTSETNDNAMDFVCGDPATPTTNDGSSVSLPATSPCGVAGDVNGDGMLDAGDVAALVSWIFSPSPVSAADVNGDTRVNAADIPALLQLF